MIPALSYPAFAGSPDSSGEKGNGRVYHIPAGSLDSALKQFTRETGIPVSGDENATRKMTTPGIQGNFTASEALEQLLAGSGLQATLRGNRYALERIITQATDTKTPADTAAATANTVRMPALTVSATRGSNYATTSTVTATKTNTLLRDIPQSISVISQDLIKDQAMQSIADVVRYVPGVGMSQGEGNTDAPIFRGTQSTADFFVDGIRDDVQYFRDLYNMQQVEVLKGPNGMIFGRGGSGGVINRVSKEAGWDSIRSLSFQAGSFDTRRTLIDVGEAISDVVAGRVNGMYENSGSYRDGVNLERYGVNPTMTIKPDNKAKIVLGGEFFHDARTADRGIPSFDGKPIHTRRSTFFGDPRRSHADVTVKTLYATMEYAFDSGITLRNRTRGTLFNKFYQNVYPFEVSSDGSMVDIAAYNNSTKRSNIFNQTDLIYTWQSGPFEHKLLAGIEVGQQITHNLRKTGYFNNDIFVPPEHPDDPEDDTAFSVVTVPVSAPRTSDPLSFRLDASGVTNRVAARITGVYIQDQIKIGPYIQAILGGRYDRFELDFHNNRTDARLRTRDNLFSPRAGLVLKPVDTVSLYTSYSLSYVPRVGDQLDSLEATNQSLSPERFINLEVGTKWDIRPGLAFTVAAYRLDRTNVVIADPAVASRSLLVKGQRSEGVEAGITGRITSAWSIAGGYAYQDGRITKTQGEHGEAGAILAQLPRHTFSLWNRYDFFPGWGLGLGVITRSHMFASVDNTVSLPGYTRLDAALYGKLNRYLRFQMNVENMLDKHYILSANNNVNITPGSPVAVRGMLILDL